MTSPEGARIPETSDWSAVRYLGDHSLLVVDVVPEGAEPARMDVVAIAKSDGHEVDRFSIVRRAEFMPEVAPGRALPIAAVLAAAGHRALRATAAPATARSGVGAREQQDQARRRPGPARRCGCGGRFPRASTPIPFR